MTWLDSNQRQRASKPGSNQLSYMPKYFTLSCRWVDSNHRLRLMRAAQETNSATPTKDKNQRKFWLNYVLLFLAYLVLMTSGAHLWFALLLQWFFIVNVQTVMSNHDIFVISSHIWSFSLKTDNHLFCNLCIFSNQMTYVFQICQMSLLETSLCLFDWNETTSYDCQISSPICHCNILI